MPPFRAQTGEGGFTGVDIMVCPHEETLFKTSLAEALEAITACAMRGVCILVPFVQNSLTLLED